MAILTGADSDDQTGADEGPTARQGVVGSIPAQIQTIECSAQETEEDKGKEEVYSISTTPT